MTSPKRIGPIDTVIFDHDGTLVDSISVVTTATNEVLRECGLAPATRGRVVAGMIHPTAHRLGLLTGIREPEARLALARSYGAAALDHAGLAELYPGIQAMLAALADRGRFMAVVSNSEGAFIRGILTRLGVAARFRAMLGEDDMEAPKPHPGGVLAALAVCGRDPGRTAYVGDSATDLATARAAGVLAIGVTWGPQSRVELEPLGFDALVAAPAELVDLVC